jgi:hypothetical protein
MSVLGMFYTLTPFLTAEYMVEVTRGAWRITCCKWRSTEAFISCKPVFMLRKKLFCVLELFCWIPDFRRFEWTYRLNLQSYQYKNLLVTLKMKAVRFLKTSEKRISQSHEAPAHNSWFLYSHSMESSRSSFRIVKNMFIYCYFMFLVYCGFHAWLVLLHKIETMKVAIHLDVNNRE